MNAQHLYRSTETQEFQLWALYGFGPSSYNQTTGDPVYGPGGGENIIAAMSAFTTDGLYKVDFVPVTVPSLRPGYVARWRFAGQTANGTVVITGATFTAGTGQTNGTYVINGSGGGGTGAQATVVIAGGVITSAVISNPGKGYTSTPTFTVAAGGTPGTVTATSTAPVGQEVPTGANLSASVVQFGAIGSQL